MGASLQEQIDEKIKGFGGTVSSWSRGIVREQQKMPALPEQIQGFVKSIEEAENQLTDFIRTLEGMQLTPEQAGNMRDSLLEARAKLEQTFNLLTDVCERDPDWRVVRTAVSNLQRILDEFLEDLTLIPELTRRLSALGF